MKQNEQLLRKLRVTSVIVSLEELERRLKSLLQCGEDLCEAPRKQSNLI